MALSLGTGSGSAQQIGPLQDPDVMVQRPGGSSHEPGHVGDSEGFLHALRAGQVAEELWVLPEGEDGFGDRINTSITLSITALRLAAVSIASKPKPM